MVRGVVLALLIVTALAAGAGSVAAEDAQEPSGSTYYRKHSRVRLGPEKRLPNGIAWRLFTDAKTRIAMPRITWMPDVRSLRTANRLLEDAHGGALWRSAAAREHLEELDEGYRARGDMLISPIVDAPYVQTDIDLTYASSALMSVVEGHYEVFDFNANIGSLEGKTFDLRRATAFGLTECTGKSVGDGEETPPGKAERDPLFEFGDLLRVCDRDALRDFVRLLRTHAEKGAERAANDKDIFVTQCIEYFRKPTYIGEQNSLRLYLTFKGLAVQVGFDYLDWGSNSACSDARTAINPVIIPYRELEPFMQPGPWRDELLALR